MSDTDLAAADRFTGHVNDDAAAWAEYRAALLRRHDVGADSPTVEAMKALCVRLGLEPGEMRAHADALAVARHHAAIVKQWPDTPEPARLAELRARWPELMES